MQIKQGDFFRGTTIQDCCSQAFGCDALPMRAYFIPKTVRERYGDHYYAWFVFMDGSVKNNWSNQFIAKSQIIPFLKVPAEKDCIFEAYSGLQADMTKHEKDPLGEERIAFQRVKGYNGKVVGYRFEGVYKITRTIYEDGKFIARIHEKTSDIFSL